MLLTGVANCVGIRSGTKNGRAWYSLVLDAIDDPVERVEYFVPDSLVDKVVNLEPGRVKATVRLYPMSDRRFGSRLVDIDSVK